MPRTAATQQDSSSGLEVYPPIVPRAPWRVAAVKALPGYRLEVRHNDGVTGIVDLSARVHNPKAGIFAALRDVALFDQVFVDLGAVTWPGEIDLAPDNMHIHLKRDGEWVLR